MSEASKISILYVCPRAHETGHYSDRTRNEIASMRRAGVEVALLTFQGLLDGGLPPEVRQYTVIRAGSWMASVIAALSAFKVFYYAKHLIYQIVCIAFAIRIVRQQGYDFCYLLNGDPYMFLPFLFAVFLRNTRWILIMMTPFYAMKGRFKHGYPPSMDMYRRLQNLILWQPVYSLAMLRNRFIIVGHDELTVDAWSGFLGGVLSGCVHLIPWGYNPAEVGVSQHDARNAFGLPAQKTILLLFGVVHQGRDPETVIEALVEMPPDICVLQVGFVPPDRHKRIVSLVHRLGVGDRYMIVNEWVSEEVKRLYFFAADAAVISYKEEFLDWPSVLWTACSLKRPIIASDRPSIRACVERYRVGLVFKTSDPQSLRLCVNRLVSMSSSEIETIRQNCNTLAQDSSSDYSAKVLAGICGIIPDFRVII
ncbi:glycosyl transferase group 1 [Candidatus Magnetobacterium bavaricum]|uniref:Glycosyl transferase group 1 n=1 Tax=Candidatus Magnetobacterium bavaricum TaxID=29290 RepID=A0A0F3GM16_9BACT|nr:glycosyl transferase group 1 [Candidatus Magnetobacterium bavaricum]